MRDPIDQLAVFQSDERGHRPSMNFVIRQARAADAAAISRLVTGLAHFFVADPSSPEVGPFLAGLTAHSYAQRIDSSEFSHYVAEDAAGPCGVIALRNGSHLYHLFVRADAHGQGIARALWEHARARTDHSTFTVNSSLYAVAVYERLGFVAKAPPQTADGLVFVPMGYADDDRSRAKALHGPG
jgi:GNAT superfamily N-acetyltransferase